MIYFRGTPGKVLASTDSINGEIPNGQKSYVAAKNGNDVTLTIDVNIQSIAEKYLSQAVTDNKADSGNVIIMNPSTASTWVGSDISSSTESVVRYMLL